MRSATGSSPSSDMTDEISSKIIGCKSRWRLRGRNSDSVSDSSSRANLVSNPRTVATSSSSTAGCGREGVAPGAFAGIAASFDSRVGQRPSNLLVARSMGSGAAADRLIDCTISDTPALPSFIAWNCASGPLTWLNSRSSSKGITFAPWNDLANAPASKGIQAAPTFSGVTQMVPKFDDSSSVATTCAHLCPADISAWDSQVGRPLTPAEASRRVLARAPDCARRSS